MDSRKDENYYPEVLLEKYYFFCSTSDEKCYDKECINLFLQTIKVS